jgi:hypothetical protein
MTQIRTFAFAGLAMAASMGAALAAPMQHVPASAYTALYVGEVSTAAPRIAGQAFYGHAGSIGRLNYGANVAFPEGPANFSD